MISSHFHYCVIFIIFLHFFVSFFNDTVPRPATVRRLAAFRSASAGCIASLSLMPAAFARYGFSPHYDYSRQPLSMLIADCQLTAAASRFINIFDCTGFHRLFRHTAILHCIFSDFDTPRFSLPLLRYYCFSPRFFTPRAFASPADFLQLLLSFTISHFLRRFQPFSLPASFQ